MLKISVLGKKFWIDFRDSDTSKDKDSGGFFIIKNIQDEHLNYLKCRQVNESVMSLVKRAASFIHTFYKTKQGNDFFMPGHSGRDEMRNGFLVLMIAVRGIGYRGMGSLMGIEEAIGEVNNFNLGKREILDVDIDNGPLAVKPGIYGGPVLGTTTDFSDRGYLFRHQHERSDFNSEKLFSSQEGSEDRMSELLATATPKIFRERAQDIKVQKKTEVSCLEKFNELSDILLGLVSDIEGSDGDSSEVIYDFKYFHALIGYIGNNFKFYFGEAYDYFHEFMEDCIDQLVHDAKPFRSADDFVNKKFDVLKTRVRAQPNRQLRGGSAGFDKAFSALYARVRLERTPTYYTYHDVLGRQGPHTIARVLSVRTNISVIKRIFSDDISKSNIPSLQAISWPFDLDAVRLVKLVEYALFVLLSFEGLEFSPAKPATVFSLREIEAKYRFCIAVSNAKNYRETASISSSYADDVVKVATGIIRLIFCLYDKLDSEMKTKFIGLLGEKELILSVLIYPDFAPIIAHGKNELAGSFESLSKSTFFPRCPDGVDIIDILAAFISILQAFHDLHPCGSAAISDINKKDLSGKGESVLYRNLVWEKERPGQDFSADFMSGFIDKAVDLRFWKLKKDEIVTDNLTSLSQLNHETVYREYFPNYPALAKNFVLRRMYAILALPELLPTVGRLPPKTGKGKSVAVDLRANARALSPERARRDQRILSKLSR